MYCQLVKYFLIFILSISTPLILTGQPVTDDFEQAHLDAWRIIEGNAEISDAYAYADNYSVRVFKSSTNDSIPAIIKHRTFEESYGKHRMKCYVLGADAEARLRFQYNDENNYYEVISRPLGTNHPELLLYRMRKGQLQLLSRVPSLIHLDTWYQITIHRTCAGEIFVYVNDVLRISTFDAELRQPGSVGLGAFGGSTYYDDITFERDQGNIVVDIDTTICTGELLRIGSKSYSEAGIYLDTISVGLDCDSILLVSLAFSQPYENHVFDTICGNEERVFGEDTLRQSGTYRQIFTTVNGCDSIVNLTLWILNGDTLHLDHTICHGDTYAFNGRQISNPGIYSDTLQSGTDCFAIRILNLLVVDQTEFLGNDTTLCFLPDLQYTLTSPSSGSTIWSDGSEGPTLNIFQPGTYWAEITAGSCVWRDSVVFHHECDSSARAFIPNAFTPNNDGINDIFRPFLPIVPRQFTLRIFDRQGRLIFTSFDPAQGWDGNVDGHHLQEGTYVYWLKADQKQFSGSITLIR